MTILLTSLMQVSVTVEFGLVFGRKSSHTKKRKKKKKKV